MNWRRIVVVGTVAGMIAITGCSSNLPETNQGNRNGQRVVDAVNHRQDTYTTTARPETTRNTTRNTTRHTRNGERRMRYTHNPNSRINFARPHARVNNHLNNNAYDRGVTVNNRAITRNEPAPIVIAENAAPTTPARVSNPGTTTRNTARKTVSNTTRSTTRRETPAPVVQSPAVVPEAVATKPVTPATPPARQSSVAKKSVTRNATRSTNRNTTNQSSLNRHSVSRSAVNQNSLNRHSVSRNAINQNSLNRHSVSKNTTNRSTVNRNSVNRSSFNRNNSVVNPVNNNLRYGMNMRPNHTLNRQNRRTVAAPARQNAVQNRVNSRSLIGEPQNVSIANQPATVAASANEDTSITLNRLERKALKKSEKTPGTEQSPEVKPESKNAPTPAPTTPAPQQNKPAPAAILTLDDSNFDNSNIDDNHTEKPENNDNSENTETENNKNETEDKQKQAPTAPQKATKQVNTHRTAVRVMK